MNILVIGNGFDLAHGLPTTYGDFLAFVEGFQKHKNNEDSNYFQYFETLLKNNPQIYGEIDEMVAENCWLNYFIMIYEKRVSEGKQGWIDFESEISNIIQTFDDARATLYAKFKSGEEKAHMERWQLKTLVPVFNIDRESLKQGTIEFDKTVINLRKEFLLNNLNKLTRCLEIYLCDYLSYDKCKALPDIAKLYIDKVLSFNYTDTYRKIYAKESSNIEYDFIHGKANISNDINSCNLVLGIDEYLSDDSRNRDNEFVEFKKFYQRIYKMTGCYYIDWLDSRQEYRKGIVPHDPPELNIYIYGHSLDVTDADILRRLIFQFAVVTKGKRN